MDRDLALAHITPSGDGLRIVMRIRKGKTIAETQHRVCEMLGIACDKAVKDISRLSFCPKEEDILYLNKTSCSEQYRSLRSRRFQVPRFRFQCVSRPCSFPEVRALEEKMNRYSTIPPPPCPTTHGRTTHGAPR